jgi:hypothetical protein
MCPNSICFSGFYCHDTTNLLALVSKFVSSTFSENGTTLALQSRSSEAMQLNEGHSQVQFLPEDLIERTG